MSDATITRRSFMTTAASAASAAAIFTIVPRHVLGGPRVIPPSEKLNIAGIGIGGMGGSNVNNSAGENIVALCDVDLGNIEKITKKFPNAKTYQDFRVMLDKQKDIDAVIVGTPDHTHAVISMAAIKAGKHV
ncbi:MAG: Gfo/Idh/MocA family oxidoreductase [Candidatus Sumerlaeota bacterium]|nr:Gfo/Idh/MocA family oxidoreductase [Candidatus Sumerlaeota bacterium]